MKQIFATIFELLLFTTCSFAASTTDTATAISVVYSIGEKDFAPSDMQTLIVNSDDRSYTVEVDDGSITINTQVMNCWQYDAKLLISITDTNGDGTVDEVNYGLDKFHCDDDVKTYYSKLSPVIHQQIYDAGIKAVNTGR